MSNKPKILITKALTKSQRATPSAMALDLIEKPFIKITYKYDLFDLRVADTWIITSANAAKYISTHIDDIDKHFWPSQVYAITESSTSIIKHTDLTIKHAGKDATSLAETIIQDSSVKKAIFFHGNKRLPKLPAILNAAGIELFEEEVYTTKLVGEIINVNAFDAIAFTSPSNIEAFSQLNSVNGQTLFAIGKTTANAVYAITGELPIVASEPTTDDLIKTIHYHFNANY